jgi:hypothetical protein
MSQVSCNCRMFIKHSHSLFKISVGRKNVHNLTVLYTAQGLSSQRMCSVVVAHVGELGGDLCLQLCVAAAVTVALAH